MRGESATSTVDAQVWQGAEGFAQRTFPLPAPGEGEAVAQVDLATICGSDVHTVAGRRSGAHPSILGHEAVGRLIAVGPGGVRDHTGTALATGDRVVWSVGASCHRCDRCLAGRRAKCRTLLKTGHEPLHGPWPLSGGYATHILLHRGLTVVQVPEVVPDPVAAMSACAAATVMACLEAAGDLAGQRVLISGAGMLGVCAAAAAAEQQPASVTVTDPLDRRRRTALAFGAGRAMDPAELAADDPIADVVIELSGAPSAVAAAPGWTDVGGRVVLAGSVSPRGPVDLDPEHLVRGLRTITGVHNYEPRHLQAAIDFLARCHYDFTQVIGVPAPLADLPAAFAAADQQFLRAAVAPGS